MPRNETVINVFVASPSDVSEERKALESVVHELNKTWSKNLNLRLDLIKWETDVHPGIGAYSQDVINEQINDEYDVFIAMFWGRVGSPTHKAKSGTLEEFNRAYRKYASDKNSVDIMVYFKDQPLPPSKIDYEQLKNIQELKIELGEKGSLYWIFENTEDFESLLRTHLSKVAQKWSSKYSSVNHGSSKTLEIAKIEETESLDDIDEYGLLDFTEIYEDRMFDMTSALAAMAEATEKIGHQFNRRTEEINALKEAGEHSDPKKARRVIKLSSDDMERYSEIMELQIRLTARSREEAFDALSKALSVYVDFKGEENSTDLNDLEDSLIFMRDAACGTIEGVSGFRETVANLPRLTIQLNKAKRRAVKVLDTVLEEVDTTVSSSNDVLKIINELKNEQRI
ncbi:hypothetical protein [Marinobacter sp. SS13-12]|uniref:hypothetical protein n=1 Tax=Marinobacter sp. SS13-12 TaxID=3050451 RepID=UPI002552CDC6|nr:hypothetical protein [Marinobacter sp. SS13-12]MDK8465258.1 hypothetical protein [Marinobacter sp. SS13-12]